MKKQLSILLCAILVLSLAACTKGSTSTRSTTTTTKETVATTTSENTTATTIGDLVTTLTTTQTEINDPEDFVGALEKEDITFEETWESENVVIVDIVTPTQPTPTTTTKPTTTTTAKSTTTTTTKPTTTTTAKPSATTTANPTTTTAKPTTTTTNKQTTTTTAKPTTTTTKPTTTTTTTKPTTPKPTTPTYTYTTNQKHTALPYTERYLYSLLDEQWKECYRRIDTAVRNLDETAEFEVNLADNRGYAIYHLYMFDTPELFYLSSSVCISNHGDGTSSLRFSYAVSNQKGEYCGYGYGNLTNELRQKIRAKKAIFDAEVQRIVSTIPANAPDVVKEKLIYDRILIDSYYNLGARWDGLAEDNWTAYGILINKYGVCESYSEAFQTLCLAVGINCTGIVGTAGGGHKWNAVQLDGEWYQCDITFDDPIGGEAGAAYHYYFNRTSEEMINLHHDWSNSDWPVPDCTATKYDYTNYFGEDRF